MKKVLFPVLILSLLASAFFFNGCKHPTPTPTPTPNLDSSWWVVNTDRYVTYATFVNGSNGATFLTGAADNSNFSITFHLPYVPAQGTYLLDCGNTASSAACMEISYKGMRYRAKAGNTDYLQADSANQKAKITLPLTWFYSTISPDLDSVAATGVFTQP
jgi:hypothetical protein